MTSEALRRQPRRTFGRAVARRVPGRTDTAAFWTYYAGWMAFFLVLLG